MKSIAGLSVLLMCLLAGSAGAYTNVGGDTNCQGCHSEFDTGTDWHDQHAALASACTDCHANGFGEPIRTSTCSVCHSPDNQPCAMVETHEANEVTAGSCITCHSNCTSDSGSDEGCDGEPTVYDGPCLMVIILGEDDPRVELLRSFRDEILAASLAGRTLIKSYYQVNDALAPLVANSPRVAQQLRKPTAGAVDAVLGALNR